MMALQLLPLLRLIIIFQTAEILAYSLPIYGTKRYGRSSQRTSSSYDPYSSYQVVPRYVDPVSYYKNPYVDTYHSSYYYPDSYPLPYYYPKVYRPVPYYYNNEQTTWPSQGYATYYDYNDPSEEYFQDTDRDDAETAQPIGHESYYEDSPEVGNMDDVNAAFLQNLILTQMYQDSLNNRVSSDSYDDYDEAFAKLEELSKKPTRAPEDETVKELKQLPKSVKDNKKNRNKNGHWAQADNNQEDGQKRKNRQRKQKQDTKRGGFESNELPLPGQEPVLYADRRPTIKIPATTKGPSTEAPLREFRGQKEQFEVRPATPVRHAFNPALTMLARSQPERKRTPSVYDTIKHLLDMEKSFENKQQDAEMRPAMKKRVVTSEENLAKQLSVLKKSQSKEDMDRRGAAKPGHFLRPEKALYRRGLHIIFHPTQ